MIMIGHLPLWRLTEPAFYQGGPRDAVSREVLRRIPPDAVVESDSRLEVYLTDRDDVYVAGRMGAMVPDYVLHDGGHGRTVDLARVVRDVEHRHHGVTFVPVIDQDGYVLLRRAGPSV